MVREEEQCNVLEPPSPTSSTSTSTSESGSDHDEGVDMRYEVHPQGLPMCGLRFRRFGDRISKGASVSREVRMRRRVKRRDGGASSLASS